MEIIAEIVAALVQLIAELFVQMLGQALGELLGHGVQQVFRRPEPTSPFLAAIGYVALGAVLGGISLLVVPELYIKAAWLRALNVIVTPVIAGLIMGAIGAWRRRHDREVIRLESFAYGALFAFSTTMVRAIWGN